MWNTFDKASFHDHLIRKTKLFQKTFQLLIKDLHNKWQNHSWNTGQWQGTSIITSEDGVLSLVVCTTIQACQLKVCSSQRKEEITRSFMKESRRQHLSLSSGTSFTEKSWEVTQVCVTRDAVQAKVCRLEQQITQSHRKQCVWALFLLTASTSVTVVWWKPTFNTLSHNMLESQMMIKKND